MSTYIKAGEWVTCENGHRICRAGKDAAAGDAFMRSMFDEWQIERPNEGDAVKPCSCGASYVEFNLLLGARVHVEGRGWSPPGMAG